MFKIGAPSGRMTYRRRLGRTIDELVGLCRGIIADGEVNQSEVEFLQQWLYANREFVNEHPFREIYAVVESALVDGVLDADEERDILATVHGLPGNVGGGGSLAARGATSTSSSLPLCNPPPAVTFEDRAFVVTGVFEYGPRATVCGVIAERGGVVKKNISRQVDYLVVGEVGSRDWLHASFGTKIRDAVNLRDAGVPLHIISEAYWVEELAGWG